MPEAAWWALLAFYLIGIAATIVYVHWFEPRPVPQGEVDVMKRETR